MLKFEEYYEKLIPEIKEYFKILCPNFPKFIIPYIETNTMERLNGVSYFCGMQYGSKKVYNFKYNITRLDHSISTALIVWNYTYDEKMTLAALFHDATTPAFSHCVDYLNEDYIKQESTELNLWTFLSYDEKIVHLFEVNGIKEDDINYKKYSLVDNERPKLCADRLDSIFLTNLAWSKKLMLPEVKKIYDNVCVRTNEEGLEEFSFIDLDIADRVVELNEIVNTMTKTKADFESMYIAANIIKRLIEIKAIKYYDLYNLTDYGLIRIIACYLKIDKKLKSYVQGFISVEKDDEIVQKELKDRKIDPLVINKRYSNR